MKSLKRAIYLAAAILLIEAQAGISNTLTVGLSGSYGYSNIQSAISAAANGDTVLVYQGTYTGEGNRDIDFSGKAITVRSVGGAKSTIIDCGGTSGNPHRGFKFHSGEQSGSQLSGFSIINGYSPMDLIDAHLHSAGGAIYCYGASPTISDCIIEKNYANQFGSGIACAQNSDPKISNCFIRNNSSNNRGGGIYCFYNCDPYISNCVISQNSAPLGGGGLYFESYSDPFVIQCTIGENSTGSGNGTAGLWCQLGSVILTDSILWDNFNSAGKSQLSQINGWQATFNVNYDCIQGLSGSLGGIGNIGNNPLFAPNSEFSLLPGSPCIDAGKDAGVYTDILGRPRPYDFPGVDNNGSLPEFDIGAYEIPEPATLLLLGLGAVILRRKRREGGGERG